MKKTAKHSIVAILAATLGLCASLAHAQTTNSVYVIDGRGQVATDPYGLCWRTGFWTPAAAATDPNGCKCDKDLIPKEVCEPKTAAPAAKAAPVRKARTARVAKPAAEEAKAPAATRARKAPTKAPAAAKAPARTRGKAAAKVEPTIQDVASGEVEVEFTREGDDVVLTVGGKRRSLDDVDDSTFEEAKEANLTNKVLEAPLDPAGAIALSHSLADEGMTPITITQNYQNMSAGMKELEAAIQAGRFHHDGNSLMTWCIGNVIGKNLPGNDDMVRPVKESADQKIDGAVALIMTIARAMVPDRGDDRSIYETSDVLC